MTPLLVFLGAMVGAPLRYLTDRAVQARHPEAGITFMKGVEYLEAPSEAYRALTEERALQQLGMQGFRLLRKEELPEGVKWGCEYDCAMECLCGAVCGAGVATGAYWGAGVCCMGAGVCEGIP